MRRFMWLMLLVAATAAQAGETGVYVAVGYGGRRMSSRDGRTWENVQQWADVGRDDSNNLMSIAYGKGKFVAVGGGGWTRETQAGHIMVSTDGKEWREVSKYPFRINPILFLGNRFVAGGPSRQLLTSEDGEHWSEGETTSLLAGMPGWAFWFRGGACGNGTFAFYGNAGQGQKTWWCVTTRDGKKIENAAFDLPQVKGLAFGAGRFVLAGEDGVYSSSDARKWTKETGSPSDELRGVIWTGKRFYLSGKQSSYISEDGTNWTPAGKTPPCSIVAADEHGFIGTGWPGSMFFSPDGQTWSRTGQPLPGLGVNAVAYGTPTGK